MIGGQRVSGAERALQPEGLRSGAVLGVVLAGGLGRRMGGADKPLLPLAGVPMVLRVAAALRSPEGAVVLATGAESARYSHLGLPCLPDPDLPLTAADQGRAGPLAAILAGLEEAGRLGLDWVLTCPADVPLVPPDLGSRMAGFLLQVAAVEGAVPPGVTVEASAPEEEGGVRWHPAIALLWAGLAPSLRGALMARERRVGGWMRQAGTLRMPWRPAAGETDAAEIGRGPDPFSNINTPEDLWRAEAALSSGRGTGVDG
ncbi:molybdenum cofactor guanylyltransferase [Novispirillum itersonii]|uniref:Molybdenum cofactor guanylyltransferase n=1 Tax=Novispirillum itersonii TaxID=189 RepID=A0A7W9ZI56_NOVIT|nr:molybdenum cofactor guanylyltransferase [Novispirillum itersonii]MBB6211928.1 molybdopterin-guanine dinucleotide biosynthesis protein A [Novispirillum itersonii]